eukprot:CAMPEP_0194358284 /NCGR_PEP_ID=MMETSP0174-20130528/5543_1 /TAXON_ID=216777 /ORGANISM="Proboscia alata, Strain PI-D3" /LENGTH=597 /DNA_ID=CAMNT_0039128549 /DNA_START=193 /DNA_END=1986 /DNA_ORIENTATION=+
MNKIQLSRKRNESYQGSKFDETYLSPHQEGYTLHQNKNSIHRNIEDLIGDESFWWERELELSMSMIYSSSSRSKSKKSKKNGSKSKKSNYPSMNPIDNKVNDDMVYQPSLSPTSIPFAVQSLEPRARPTLSPTFIGILEPSQPPTQVPALKFETSDSIHPSFEEKNKNNKIPTQTPIMTLTRSPSIATTTIKQKPSMTNENLPKASPSPSFENTISKISRTCVPENDSSKFATEMKVVDVTVQFSYEIHTTVNLNTNIELQQRILSSIEQSILESLFFLLECSKEIKNRVLKSIDFDEHNLRNVLQNVESLPTNISLLDKMYSSQRYLSEKDIETERGLIFFEIDTLPHDKLIENECIPVPPATSCKVIQAAISVGLDDSSSNLAEKVRNDIFAVIGQNMRNNSYTPRSIPELNKLIFIDQELGLAAYQDATGTSDSSQTQYVIVASVVCMSVAVFIMSNRRRKQQMLQIDCLSVDSESKHSPSASFLISSARPKRIIDNRCTMINESEAETASVNHGSEECCTQNVEVVSKHCIDKPDDIHRSTFFDDILSASDENTFESGLSHDIERCGVMGCSVCLRAKRIRYMLERENDQVSI